MNNSTVVKRDTKPLLALPVFAPYNSNKFLDGLADDTGPNVSVKTGDGFGERLSQEKVLREEEMTNKDVRGGRDLSMRQMLRIDNRPSGDSMERYKHGKENAEN